MKNNLANNLPLTEVSELSEVPKQMGVGNLSKGERLK